MVIMRGIPGSGKSHAARKYLEDNSFRRINYNERRAYLAFSERYGLILSTDDYWGEDYNFIPAKMKEAHEWNQNRADESALLEFGCIVIDNTNTVAWEWEPYLHIAKNHDYDVTILYPDTPWWNVAERNMRIGNILDSDVAEFENRNTHGVPEQIIRRMMERFQFTD